MGIYASFERMLEVANMGRRASFERMLEAEDSRSGQF